MLLPVLAIVFALASAFASAPFGQLAWYDSNGSTSGGGMQGEIVNAPDGACSTTSGTHICKIQVGPSQVNAFDSQANAEANGGTPNAGILKYN